MRKDVNRWDITKFCRFHNDYGHETNECNHLKEEIELLIRQNNAHLKRYVRPTADQHPQQSSKQQSQYYQSNQPLLPPLVAGWLYMICGELHLAGNFDKARERYAHSLRHEQEEDVLDVQERTSKQPRYECEPITFSEEDTSHIHHPHNYSLVVEVQIANMIVARTMIDHGSSANIMFKSTMERMNLSIRDLEHYEQLLYDFTENGMALVESIRLSLTVGTTPNSNTVMALFVVIDIPSPYNAMIGRPITSVFHLLVKFPTRVGIGCLKGNQLVARECYNLLVKKAGKAVFTAQPAGPSH
ncbi:uncharacterized protein LOC133777749 [Humulus lupulus]|uniref:uncharacterized protein LOC133777749 n=1 Tax=Humulus lupulus TaxID=3486 RepID=UPI002B410246|nr:uncharacterized protein LOC133777749 [Humulus lupulus]